MAKQSFGRLFGRWAPLAAWLFFISFASSDGFSAANTSRIIGPLVQWFFPGTSAETLELVHLCTRKLAHFAEYAFLGLLASRAFLTSPHSLFRRRWFVISIILIVTYALLDEYHQSYVPSRTASIYDSLLDTIGGFAALVFIRFRHIAGDSSNSPISAYNQRDSDKFSNQ